MEAGVAFWNSYKAMGGGSSIVKWADRKPALAQKDYVHFTYQGADTLSKILEKSLFSVDRSGVTNLKDSVVKTNNIVEDQARSEVAIEKVGKNEVYQKFFSNQFSGITLTDR